jgi:hypothetical protein
MTEDNREALRGASVEKALQDYTNDIMDCSAGYNILRYARQGLLTYKEQGVKDD